MISEENLQKLKEKKRQNEESLQDSELQLKQTLLRSSSLRGKLISLKLELKKVFDLIDSIINEHT